MIKFIECLVYLALLSFSSFLLGRILPKSWFRYNLFPFKDFKFEKSGKIYLSTGVKKWKSKVPDMSIIMSFLIPSKKLPKAINADSVKEMLIENCISEVILNDKFSTDMLEYSLNQILRYIIRDFLPGDKTARLNINSSQELCYQMMNYINTHIYVISGLKELSEYFGYNYGYLSGVFHKTTGQTLMEYYTVCRLKSATVLIKENALNFAEIAELLNYSSVYAFSRAFKNHFGISPKAYKKQLSINETDKK